MQKLSKTEELIHLRKENVRLQQQVDQLMENGSKYSFYHYFYEVKETIDADLIVEFDESYYIGLITLTFDRKFVWFHHQDKQLDYIQKSIFKAFNGFLSDYRVVFAVEHHKDGTLHAHMLIQHKINNQMSYTNVVNYRYALGLYFTDRVDSKRTVRLDDVDEKRSYDDIFGLKGALRYIEKENYKIFKKKNI